jgi:predicted ATPase
MRVALARHYDLLAQAVSSHRGYVFKTVGDAVCAAFDTPADALAGALAGQRALRAEPWGGVGPIRVRMALHTGVAEERAGDYFGPPLNRVARLLAAGHGGQVLLSQPTYDLVRDELLPGVELRDLGEHRLKDLGRPERVFQVLHPELPAEFPPLKTLDARPHNLPVQATPLIDREAEVAAVSERLLRADVRLLTLTGPGGSGKTRLGLQVAAELLDHFGDGAVFVALAPVRDPALVASAVAQALGILATGGRPLLESVKEAVRDRQLLLVLDNFEQVLPAAPVVAELLAAGPRLKVLVTSRAVLGLYGEHNFLVPPLPLPDRQRLPPLEALPQYAAVALFIERATAARSDFRVTNANAPAIAEICHRLDGLPLGIELAAARARLLPPQAMLARLGHRFSLLIGGARNAPARQQTLRAAIDWSHDLLDEGEQALFRRLGVFVGGLTLEAAGAICDPEGELAVDVLDGIASLVDKSLLKEEATGDEPRFTMLETIREYALERLEASGEAEAVYGRHAAYFLDLAGEAQRQLRGPEQVAWLNCLEAEHDNLRAALEWCLAPAGHAQTGLRLAGILASFWFARGHAGEGRRRLEAALARTGAEARTAERARALSGIAPLAYLQGDYAEARAALKESAAIGRELGDKQLVAYPLMWLGLLAELAGNAGSARALEEESIALYREVGDAWGLAGSAYMMGMMFGAEGEGGTARSHFEEAVAQFRKLGDRWGLALSLQRLGHLALERANAAEAVSLFHESLTLLRDVGDPVFISRCLQGLALVAITRGNYRRAGRLFGAAEAFRVIAGATSYLPDRPAYERAVATLRANLDEETLAAAWAEGCAMPLEQAIAYALETEVPA